MNPAAIGKMLMLFGAALFACGLLMAVFHKIPFLGKLPGDIVIERKNSIFYFPLATSLLVSAVLSFVLWLWSRR